MTAELIAAPTSSRMPSPWLKPADEGILDVAVALRALDVQHRRFRDSAASALGLSLTEFGALTFIADNREVTPKAIATELSLTTGATTALLDRLTTAGLVERSPHPTDRRSLLVHLSAYGEERRDWVYDHYLTAVSHYCAITAPEIATAFTACVTRAATALEHQIDGLETAQTLASHSRG